MGQNFLFCIHTTRFLDGVTFLKIRHSKDIDNLLSFLLPDLCFVLCSPQSWGTQFGSIAVQRDACVPHTEVTELFCLGCVWIQLKWHGGVSTPAVPRRLSFTSGLFEQAESDTDA